MIFVGAILMLVFMVALVWGPDDGNAAPFLVLGGFGLLLVIGGAIDAAIH